MSAWGAGALTIERHVPAVPPSRAGGADVAAADEAERGRATTTKNPGIDTLITWIPGEVIAAYGAVVLALQPTAESGSEQTVEPVAFGWP